MPVASLTRKCLTLGKASKQNACQIPVMVGGDHAGRRQRPRPFKLRISRASICHANLQLATQIKLNLKRDLCPWGCLTGGMNAAEHAEFETALTLSHGAQLDGATSRDAGWVAWLATEFTDEETLRQLQSKPHRNCICRSCSRAFLEAR